MRLILQEKVFSWRERFYIRDEAGRERYSVEGELFSWGKKLHILDENRREVAYIQERLLTFLRRYDVFVGNDRIGEVVQEFSFLRPRYTVEGPGWSVEGDFLQHDYVVYRGGVPVVSIQKEWLTWGDCYVLDIRDSQDEIQALALVLAIDCAVERSNQS